MTKICKNCGKAEIEHLKRFSLCKKFEPQEVCVDCGRTKDNHESEWNKHAGHCDTFKPQKGCGMMFERGAFTYKCGDKQGRKIKLCEDCKPQKNGVKKR